MAVRYLVVLGRNNPSPYTVNGRPLYVHLNGLAIVALKYAIKPNIRVCKSATEVKLARLSNLRTKMLNHISIWFIQEACFGV